MTSQMTDRELLELAAKGAGVGAVLCYESARNCLRIGTRSKYRLWRPLTDDGDALRLALTLRLNLEFLDGFKQVQAYRKGDAQAKEYQLFGLVGYGNGTAMQPTLENVRRAIVRAAAEIGRSMP